MWGGVGEHRVNAAFEDSYFQNPDGTDAKSILSLLPRRLPEGVKIITASRPNPRLPEDVLCDADRRIVSLKPSPIAEKSINRKDMKIFFKSDVAVDIGAFLAACGGVLTVEDLRRLLTMRGYQRIRTPVRRPRDGHPHSQRQKDEGHVSILRKRGH